VLNGWICLHGVLDEAGSWSVFQRILNHCTFIHSHLQRVESRTFPGLTIHKICGAAGASPLGSRAYLEVEGMAPFNDRTVITGGNISFYVTLVI